MTIESRDSVGGIVRATQLNKKKIYVLQIGASSFYKSEKLCFIANYCKRSRLGKLYHYKLGQLLQIRASVITK